MDSEKFSAFKPPAVELQLPVVEMSVPVMIALLARIQDQLQGDKATNALAPDLACVIARLLALRPDRISHAGDPLPVAPPLQ